MKLFQKAHFLCQGRIPVSSCWRLGTASKKNLGYKHRTLTYLAWCMFETLHQTQATPVKLSGHYHCLADYHTMQNVTKFSTKFRTKIELKQVPWQSLSNIEPCVRQERHLLGCITSHPYHLSESVYLALVVCRKRTQSHNRALLPSIWAIHSTKLYCPVGRHRLDFGLIMKRAENLLFVVFLWAEFCRVSIPGQTICLSPIIWSMASLYDSGFFAFMEFHFVLSLDNELNRNIKQNYSFQLTTVHIRRQLCWYQYHWDQGRISADFEHMYPGLWILVMTVILQK